MSWLDEAQAIIKNKQNVGDESDFAPNTADGREKLTRRLKTLYDNATEREIDKAVDDALDRFDAPYNEKAFIAFLQTKLED